MGIEKQVAIARMGTDIAAEDDAQDMKAGRKALKDASSGRIALKGEV